MDDETADSVVSTGCKNQPERAAYSLSLEAKKMLKERTTDQKEKNHGAINLRKYVPRK
jgi:hypothetical protein